MRKALLISILALLLSVPLGGVAAADGSSHKPQSRIFTSQLSGDQQVPPVTTEARGLAVFWLGSDGKQLHYRLLVSNLRDVTMAHIHLGTSGQNGPHVVTLFHPMSPVTVTGELASGTITSAQLEDKLAGHSLSDLLAKMTSGDTYVNVHTKKYPDGEIRGQVKSFS